MTHRNLWAIRAATLGGIFAALGAPRIALAQVTGEAHPERPREPTSYPAEIEPHLAFGAGNVYGAAGFGAGVRLGLPIAEGHLGRVPENLAISLGADLLHYENCYYGPYCSANYIFVPAAVQWNVAVARPVSVFLEGGAYLYKGFFDTCGPNDVNCRAPADFGLLPTLAIGGRFHLSDDVALTLRLGYPTTTFGVSFL